MRVSGLGQTGPYASGPASARWSKAISGFAARNGFPDREPVLPPLAMADMIAGLYGAIATLIAVRDIEQNGGGARWSTSACSSRSSRSSARRRRSTG